MTVRKAINRLKKRKCDHCGAEGQYNLTYKRHVRYIYDGPRTPPIGHEDKGMTLIIKCTACGWDMDPTDEDIDRFYPPLDKEEVVFY
jgi:DNA-directed RNA polymerase subunit M/transcription elongation factor TFIIS